MSGVETGATFGERYVLTERIATGGMGEVWKARDEVLNREVAVKVLKREFADDADFVERFRGEARHTAGLAHPGIAGVYDYGQGNDTSYLVMELVPGEPLSAVLRRDGRLTPERTLDVVAQAARALEAAHQGGVIHRDIKPGNILVCPDGVVKLTDFGIARAADAVPLTQTGMVMGTAHYLSPEQGNGKPVTPASDVYSLGVVAYECLAGRRPFEGNTPVGIAMAHMYEDPLALPEDVPEEVADLVAQALAKEPDERFASAAAFAKAAEVTRARLNGTGDAATVAVPAAGIDRTQVLPPVGATSARLKPGRHGPSRNTVLAVLGVALLLLFVAAAYGLTRGGGDGSGDGPPRAVPALVGKKQDVALAALKDAGFDAVEKKSYSSRYAAGTVMAQSPKDGTMLREGDDVSVTVSQGPQPVKLPTGLVGQQYQVVSAALEDLGLSVTPVRKVDEKRFGTVLSVTPNTGLHKGDKVTVTYSVGLPKRDDEGKGDKDDEKKGKDD